MASAVAGTGIGVPSGGDVWSKQDTRTIGIARNAHRATFVIRVLSLYARESAPVYKPRTNLDLWVLMSVRFREVVGIAP